MLLNGVQVEAPLDGTMLLMMNNDQPGVIGAVGTILGRHDVNIANFALGRRRDAAPSASSPSTTRRGRAVEGRAGRDPRACQRRSSKAVGGRGVADVRSVSGNVDRASARSCMTRRSVICSRSTRSRRRLGERHGVVGDLDDLIAADGLADLTRCTVWPSERTAVRTAPSPAR